MHTIYCCCYGHNCQNCCYCYYYIYYHYLHCCIYYCCYCCYCIDYHCLHYHIYYCYYYCIDYCYYCCCCIDCCYYCCCYYCCCYIDCCYCCCCTYYFVPFDRSPLVIVHLFSLKKQSLYSTYYKQRHYFYSFPRIFQLYFLLFFIKLQTILILPHVLPQTLQYLLQP